MKLRTVVLIIAAIIFVDQALKIWVKTHMHYGEHITLIPNWFRLFFIENEGMAWGWKFGGEWGKMLLTIFRLGAVIFGVFYIRKIVRKKYHRGFIICVGLIFAGALGNLIDSMFYGLIFDKGMKFDSVINSTVGYPGMASFSTHGYAPFLRGNVVDMLYVPIIEDKTLPSWIPFWGGENFTFFSPIFNIADASISIGVIVILLFQKRFFRKKIQEGQHPTVETSSTVNDTAQVL